jgi:hypothetical protein
MVLHPAFGNSVDHRTILTANCDDVLRNNDHLYAKKARRKKIALIRVDVTNSQSSDVHVLLGSTKLTSAGKTFTAENPAVILRKLSEFTWDFLLYSIVDFYPITAVIEAFVFLTGPLYNRRLKRQLALLSDGEMALRPGESKAAVIAFRGVSKELEWLTIWFRSGDEKQELQLAFNSK